MTYISDRLNVDDCDNGVNWDRLTSSMPLFLSLLLFPVYFYVSWKNKEKDKEALIFPITNHFFKVITITHILLYSLICSVIIFLFGKFILMEIDMLVTPHLQSVTLFQNHLPTHHGYLLFQSDSYHLLINNNLPYHFCSLHTSDNFPSCSTLSNLLLPESWWVFEPEKVALVEILKFSFKIFFQTLFLRFPLHFHPFLLHFSNFLSFCKYASCLFQ